MKDRPILMSAPMVRALLDGTKTQTRRIVKPQPDPFPADHCIKLFDTPDTGDSRQPMAAAISRIDEEYKGRNPHLWSTKAGFGVRCPFGRPADRLWVRETWHLATGFGGDRGVVVKYAADDTISGRTATSDAVEKYGQNLSLTDSPRRPSIFMPRWASRITLELTGVRVERLRDISVDDCRAEGCDGSSNSMGSPYTEYAALWSKINGTEGPNSWDANPFVWVISFKRINQ